MRARCRTVGFQPGGSCSCCCASGVIPFGGGRSRPSAPPTGRREPSRYRERSRQRRSGAMTSHRRPAPHGWRLGPVHANTKASLPSAAFATVARVFAEREARKAGLID
jgi:hypothetical protein